MIVLAQAVKVIVEAVRVLVETVKVLIGSVKVLGVEVTIVLDQAIKLKDLKVLTNEKRGGLKVATFGRSPFKLFSLKFSAKSVQALSCERLKTTQRTLFLLFANNNCFPITL